MELKPGYKQTEVGVIPDDWEVRTLQDLCKEEITYGIVQCGPHVSGGIPYIRVSDMDGPILDKEKMLCTSGEIASKFRRSEVRLGDIVYALRGRLGDVSAITLELEGANLTQGTARISPALCVHGPYLLWALRNPDVVLRTCAESKGTTFMEITLSDLRKIKIAVPSRAEQLKISSTLSDIDDHLMTLDLELTKKRNIKQAAMQELLTGKRRLPGFEGEWEVKRLAEIGEIKSGGTPSTNQPALWDGGIPWCTPTDITALRGQKYLTATARTISLAGLEISSAETIPSRSLIMTSRATIGECAINLFPMTTNQGFKNIVPSSFVDIEFLYYLMSTQKNGLISLCGGSTFLEIGKKELSAYKIRLPPDLREQSAISAVLSEIDDELQLLEARLAKASNLKQGMMQQLLTGKIRLR
jgi:type I restriction enzyme S subunit